MGTRSGDIDAGAVTFIMDKEGLDTHGISDLLNKKSGLAGISGGSSDFRDILAGIAAGNDRARLAKEMYCYRIRKYIGEYAAAMGGVDIILLLAALERTSGKCARAQRRTWSLWV